jgi:hypothetical protein
MLKRDVQFLHRVANCDVVSADDLRRLFVIHNAAVAVLECRAALWARRSVQAAWLFGCGAFAAAVVAAVSRSQPVALVAAVCSVAAGACVGVRGFASGWPVRARAVAVAAHERIYEAVEAAEPEPDDGPYSATAAAQFEQLLQVAVSPLPFFNWVAASTVHGQTAWSMTVERFTFTRLFEHMPLLFCGSRDRLSQSFHQFICSTDLMPLVRAWPLPMAHPLAAEQSHLLEKSATDGVTFFANREQIITDTAAAEALYGAAVVGFAARLTADNLESDPLWGDLLGAAAVLAV